MQDKSFSCCFANSCFLPCTYYYSARLLGADEGAASITACGLCCQRDIPLLKCVSVYLGWATRSGFDATPLAIPDGTWGANICVRCCCEESVVCQEVDIALQVAKTKDRTTSYGPLYKAECCMFVDESGAKAHQRRPLGLAAFPVVGSMQRFRLVGQ